MELEKILDRLYRERAFLSEAIRALETVSSKANVSHASRRGRKSMPPAEREEVSRRMRAYWAARRKR